MTPAPRLLGLGAAALALVAALGAAPAPASASDPSLRIEPATVAVGAGAAFMVRVVQDVPVPVSGAQVTIAFDPTLLQVQAVERGVSYADAPIQVPDLDAAAATANATGRLSTVASAFTPPGAVAAGTAELLRVTFRASGCGDTSLDLPIGPLDASLIDGREASYGQTIGVATAGGAVALCVAPDQVSADASDPFVPVAAVTDPVMPWPAVAGLALVALALALGAAWLRARGRANTA